MDIKIIQHNANKSKAVMLQLEKEINYQNIDLVLIQEPYTYNGKVAELTSSFSIAVYFQRAYVICGHSYLFQMFAGNLADTVHESVPRCLRD